jgi:hypothetical protein
MLPSGASFAFSKLTKKGPKTRSCYWLIDVAGMPHDASTNTDFRREHMPTHFNCQANCVRRQRLQGF